MMNTSAETARESKPALNDLLTVEQAAEHLKLSQSSIRSYIREGKLKAFRIAGLRKVLIPRAELLLLLEPVNSAITSPSEQHDATDEGQDDALTRCPSYVPLRL